MDASSPRDEADIDPIILADVARVVEQLLKQGGGTDGLGDLQALLGPGVVLDTVEEDSEKIIDLLQVHRQQQEDQDMQDLQEQQQQVDDDSNNDQQYGESQEQCAEQPKPADRDIVKKYIMEEDKGTIPTESANGGEGNLAIIPTPIITTTAAATAAAPVISPSQMKHNTALLSPTLNHNKDSMESEKKKKKNIRSRNTTSGTCSSSSSTPSILLSPGGHAFGPDREDHVYYEHPPANYYPPQVTEKLPMASSAVAYHTQITSSTVSSSGVLSPSLSTGSLSSIDKRNSASDAGGTIHDPYTNGTAGQTSTTGFASSVMTTADHATSMLHSAMLPSSNLKITRPRRKKALLIGINYFGDPNQLPGCINDTRDIFGFLNGYYGFRYQDTVMLTDDQIYEDKRPSGANIRYWMKWLVQDAEPHDSLFFHYAGHGGRVKDFSYNGSADHLGDEADGYDEVIFPCDYLRSGIISDDEMYDLLVKELPEGVQLTALIDSCHSGTMLDLPFVYNGDQFTQLEPHMPRAKTGVMAAMTVDEANHANGAVAPSIEPRETNRPQASTSVGFMTGQALENVIAADPVTGSRSTGPESDGASTSLSSSSSPSVLSSSSADSAKRKEGSSADGSTQEGNGQGNGEDKEGSSPPSSKRSKDNQGSTKAPAFALQPAALIEQAPDSSSPLSPTRSESSHSSRKRVKSEGQGLHLFRKTKGNVVMFSGCRDDQASADIRANDKNNTVTKIGPRGEKDSIQGSPAQPFHQPQSFTAPLARGAVTYAWIQCLSRKPEQSYEELLHSMRFFMKQRDLEQVPQLGSGLPMDMNTIFTL